MVAWMFAMKTPEYPEGRRAVVIANDITFQIGSFGVTEDHLFFKASELARKLGLPRIYISANSGARIGLADEVKQALKAAWVDENHPELGFSYLYVSDADKETLERSGSLKTTPISIGNGITHHRITDIIGTTDGLGVENLRGSGLIAGETSRAYEDIFTITLVSCRSVGKYLTFIESLSYAS